MSLTLNMSGSGGGSKAKIVFSEIGSVETSYSSDTARVIITPENISIDTNYFQQNSDNSITCLKAGSYTFKFGAQCTVLNALIGTRIYVYINTISMSTVATLNYTINFKEETFNLQVGSIISFRGPGDGGAAGYGFITIEKEE